MSAGLLLVASLDLDLLADSLLVCDLRNCQLDVNAELGLDLCCGHLDVLLAQTAEDLLLGAIVLRVSEGRILLSESLHTC